MDRAVAIVDAAGGDFELPKYWITDGNDVILGDDSANNFLKPDVSGSVVDNSSEAGEETALNNVTTAITVKQLETGAGSVIDLTYLNTNGLNPLVSQDTSGNIYTGLEYVDGKGDLRPASVKMKRTLIADTAILGNDTTLRLGVYGNFSNTGIINDNNDKVYIVSAQQAQEQIDSGTTTNLNIQLGWVPGVGTSPFGEAETYNGLVLSIYNGAEDFDVTAKKSIADGIFSMYEITPEISRHDNYFKTENSKQVYYTDANGNYYKRGSASNERIVINDSDGKPFRAADPDNLTSEEWNYLKDQGAIELLNTYDNMQGTAWILDSYSYEDTGEMAESGKTISENSTVMNNFVKANNLSTFRRFDSLHVSNLNRPETGGRGPGDGESALAGELRENLWADVWHGKFDAKAAYTRNTNQSYNGFQVGYDKLLSKSFYNGKIYTGSYASKIDGKSTTYTGKGEQDSYGIGIYSSWVGDKGHFIDMGINAAKIKNDYHFTGNTGNGSIGKVKGENSTWAYGIGAQYGKRNQLAANWFWEPSVSLYVGHVDESNYSLSNGLGVHEQGYDTAIGKLGLKAGKNIGEKGNVYAGVSWGHEFAGGQKLHQSYGTQSRLIETVGGNDSWWEWNIGGKVKVSSNGTFNLDFVKTTGSDVGNEWSINGGLNFSWGGFESGGSKAAKVNASGGEPSVSGGFAKANAPTVVVGQASKVGNVQLPQMQQSQQSVTVESGSADSQNVYDMGEANSRVVSDDTGSVSGTVTGGMGEFELGGLTVEAKRPDWEKKLSPGQVSVIYTKEFEGEQKDLPTLLQRVPGMYIHRISGAGHYTVARVRGSSASQVNVYIDGVLMNLNGDNAVDLSAIPVDNVERIEVYRGYVPARFSGAPLGGAINIVTKKPAEGTGHITQGIKSYGGYSSTYEYSMPLGSGSLLATYARDIWQGDFPYLARDGGGLEKYDQVLYRKSNGYQNNNAMLKWQDDKWTVKAVYKKLHEELPVNITGMQGGAFVNTWREQMGYNASEQNIDYKEFSVGQRDTSGNLDWGWRVDYLDSKKEYRNTGAYKWIADAKEQGLSTPTENSYLPGRLWSEYQSKKWNGNLNLAMKMGSNHLLEFNGDFSREKMEANGNRWGLSDYDASGYIGDRERKMLRKYSINEYHFTLQDTITLNDDGDLKLTPIFRGDKVEMETMGSNDQSWKWSGGVALQKQINDHWSFKTTWGTYNRHPNFYEIFGDGGYIRPSQGTAEFFDVPNGDIWESGRQFDFSLNWQGKLAKADTSTILTWFKRNAKNQLVLATPYGAGADILATYFNMDEAKIHGIELAHNMQWRRLGLNLAATWQKSEGVQKDTGTWFKSLLSMTPEWVVSARLDYLFPGDKLSVFTEYNYNDKYVLGYYKDSSGHESVNGIEAYWTLDIGAKYKFDKNWKLSAGVNDVFNKGYDVMSYYNNRSNYGSIPCPLAGRMYYTTLEYSF